MSDQSTLKCEMHLKDYDDEEGRPGYVSRWVIARVWLVGDDEETGENRVSGTFVGPIDGHKVLDDPDGELLAGDRALIEELYAQAEKILEPDERHSLSSLDFEPDLVGPVAWMPEWLRSSG